MKEFDTAGRGIVSLIPSILVGVTLCAGPAASSLTNRYGCRPVTILGAVAAAAGLAASAAAPSVVFLCVSVGLCTGLGFGLIYLPAIVSVSMYFEKRRAFATGVAVCGSGLGTFIMAPVTRGLIDALEWRGALAATGGLVLTCVAFGALFRPIKPPEEEEEEGEDEDDGEEKVEEDSDSDFDEEDRKGLLMEAQEGTEETLKIVTATSKTATAATRLPTLMEVVNGDTIKLPPPPVGSHNIFSINYFWGDGVENV